MKNIIPFILFLSLISCQSLEKKTCTIQLDIDGLNTGDIIVFTTIQKPIYEILSEDTLFVMEPNRSTFSRELAHTTCINIKYKPQNANLDSYSLGAFLVKPGDNIRLQGSIAKRSAILASGGFYSDSLVTRLEYIKKSKDTSLSEELNKLQTYMMKEVNDSEYAVYTFLDNLTYVTYDELCARFDGLEAHIKTSYMGQCLNNTIKTWASLQPDKQSPDFSVRDIYENVVNLTDYKGQYLLIYCWDFCPTTLQVQKRVIDLYQSFGREHFAVIAFTPESPEKRVSGISATGYDDTAPIVIKMRQQFLDQLAQPWPLVYTNHPNNHFIIQKYYICNSTMLTFIAPDGKIIARSYFTDLEEILQTIEHTLRQKMPNT